MAVLNAQTKTKPGDSQESVKAFFKIPSRFPVNHPVPDLKIQPLRSTTVSQTHFSP